MVELLTKRTHGTQALRAQPSMNGADAAFQIAVPDTALGELADLFKLLADNTRLRILYFLTQQHEIHVQSLCSLLDQNQPAVSHHLAQLMKARLLQRRRQGKRNYYSLRSGHLTELLNQFFERLPEHPR